MHLPCHNPEPLRIPQPNTRMKARKSAILSAAVTGLLFGTAACSKEAATPSTPGANQPAGGAPSGAPVGDVEKHACKGMNTCKGKGGCGATKAKNECAGKGECATVAHHGCATKNECKGQGGCGATKGKNECKGKGGCAVPVKH
ncbi:MAG: hypothetical protein IPK26_10550 [Planctomycetes bacterium]|nr:hypothetical protein [Planctomycetota bacterium]